MGCDIHLFFEGKWKGKWVYIKRYSPSNNYNAFALLADVRNDIGIKPINYPKGLPNDISEKIKEKLNEDFYHNFSWLNLEDFNNYKYWDKKYDNHNMIFKINKETGERKRVLFNYYVDGYETVKYLYIHEKITSSDIKNTSFITNIIYDLKQIKKNYEDSRVIFWFDN